MRLYARDTYIPSLPGTASQAIAESGIRRKKVKVHHSVQELQTGDSKRRCNKPRLSIQKATIWKPDNKYPTILLRQRQLGGDPRDGWLGEQEFTPPTLRMPPRKLLTTDSPWAQAPGGAVLRKLALLAGSEVVHWFLVQRHYLRSEDLKSERSNEDSDKCLLIRETSVFTKHSDKGQGLVLIYKQK